MRRLRLALIVALGHLAMIGSTQAIAPASPTQLLKNIKVQGEIQLDGQSDQIFEQIYRIITNASGLHTYRNVISQDLIEPPATFFAWDTSDFKPPDDTKLIFKDPSLWELLEAACKIRHRQLVDLQSGVACLSQGRTLPAREDIIKRDHADILFAYPPESPLSLVRVSNDSKLITTINAYLKKTSGFAGRPGALQITAAPTKGENQPYRTATFIGYLSYLDLLYLYGTFFDVQFTIDGSSILMHPRNVSKDSQTN